jgi:hypothetical protein
MRIAFKEWAVVVDALGRGEQALILRKGGIAEGGGGFKVEHPEFLLFPTLFHQQREAVVPAAQARFDQIEPSLPGPDSVRIEFWAEITIAHRIANLPQALGLGGLHVWTDKTISDRFDWGREEGIWGLVLRIYRLPEATQLRVLPEYGGCKSWISLATDVATDGSAPVLPEVAWEPQRAEISRRLSQPII